MTVVIPAHNESRVIGRLLEHLVHEASHGDLEIIVVANGCTDDTAAVAATYAPSIRVIDIPVPSKRAALQAGDEAAQGFPRIYLDADVELDAEAIKRLGQALDQPGVLAAGPERELDTALSAWPVRWYYDVWRLLPGVRQGLFGRGVIAVNEGGYKRLAELPPLLADDLAASLAFSPAERRVVPGARVVVHTPRTLGDLIRRRIRVVTGVNQIEQSAESPERSERTSVRDLLTLLTANPLLAPKLAVFLAVTVAARRAGNRAARRKDYTTWLRDESSRQQVLAGQSEIRNPIFGVNQTYHLGVILMHGLDRQAGRWPGTGAGQALWCGFGA
jgi:glycosyltransferase involved in cell wall biosynthesis